MRTTTSGAAAVLAVAGLAFLGCGDRAGSRSDRPPPVFESPEQRVVKSTMWQLADNVSELDRIMRRHGGIDREEHLRVVALLERIDSLVGALTPAERAGHPLLESHLGKLARDVARARETVTGQPPNYYFAGAVSGACVYCHSPPI